MFDLSLRAVPDALRFVPSTILRTFDPTGSRNLALANRHQMAAALDERLLTLPELSTLTLLDAV